MPVLGDSYVRNLVGTYTEIDRQLEEQKAAAIRWQGARDYETLVQSGVDPRDALRRTGQKIFYNDPRALAATIPSLLSQPGGLMTDPESGRRFTVDRFGNYKPVPERPPAYRTLFDERGQKFVVPFQPGEGGVSVPSEMGTPAAPRIWQAGPGMSPYAIRPGGGMTRMIRDPNAIAAGKIALQKAQEDGAESLRRYRAAEVAQAAGKAKVGWNVPWNPTVTSEMAAAKKELEQLGLDTTGQPLQGSELFRQVYGESYEAPGAPAAPAPVAPAAPAPPPQAPPVAAPPRLESRQLPGGGFMLRRAPAAPGGPGGPVAAPPAVPAPAQAPRQPGPDEVIRVKRMPDGTVVRAIFNSQTREFIGYAD